MTICRAVMTRVASSHERPLCDSRAVLLLERRRLLKEHNVSWLVDSGSFWEDVSPAHQARKRSMRFVGLARIAARVVYAIAGGKSLARPTVQDRLASLSW